MIQIPFSNGNSYSLKNQWEELDAKEYKVILNYIMQMMNGQISLQQLRLQVLFLLSGLKPRLVRNTEKADQQAENIYRMAQRMNFMLRIEYENHKAFAKLPKGIRGMLERYLPSELDQTPEVRWAERTAKTIKPDLVFARNLIPTIGRCRHIFDGYTFEVHDNILVTSLTTSQFIDAQTVCAQIEHSDTKSLLNMLVAILYSPRGWFGLNAPAAPSFYSSQQAAERAKHLDWLDMETKKAIFINFNAIQTFLCTRTKYSILFNAPDEDAKKTKPKHTLGLESVAYSLIKAGYSDVENSNLVKFFEIMYTDLVSNVTSLHKQGLTIDKIAEQTGLTLSKINQIL